MTNYRLHLPEHHPAPSPVTGSTTSSPPLRQAKLHTYLVAQAIHPFVRSVGETLVLIVNTVANIQCAPELVAANAGHPLELTQISRDVSMSSRVHRCRCPQNVKVMLGMEDNRCSRTTLSPTSWSTQEYLNPVEFVELRASHITVGVKSGFSTLYAQLYLPGTLSRLNSIANDLIRLQSRMSVAGPGQGVNHM